MKVLALYLPQFHETEQNNMWWGKGYTEWTAVKNARAYSQRQSQPRIPLNNNYYDLSDPEAKTLKWQAELALKNNIYGFVFYHYWFETGKQMLEKPMEILLHHPEINIKYCICWANESWRRGWYGTSPELLAEQKYGGTEEYTAHFNYLLQFFNDNRYIRVNGKPMICIYHSSEIVNMEEMISVWQQLAKQNGFPGLYIVSGNTGAKLDYRTNLFDAYYNFEPSYSLSHKYSKIERTLYVINVALRKIWNKIIPHKLIERPINGSHFIQKMKREDSISDAIIYPGIFPQWDNSPRRKETGTFFYNMNPNAFSKQIEIIKKRYNEAEYVFVNAWNEWGEGAYLEPDEITGTAYLEVIKNAFSD